MNDPQKLGTEFGSDHALEQRTASVSHHDTIKRFEAIPGEQLCIRVRGTQVNRRYAIMENIAAHVLILRLRWIAAGFLAWSVLIGVYTAAANDKASKFPDVKSDPSPTYVQGPAGEIFTFLKTGRSTCGTYVMADGVIPPGAGPFPHVHHFTDEWFYFPDGGLTIEMGVREYPDINIIPGKNAPKDQLYLYDTRPGDIVYGPRYIIHGFQNKTNKPHRLVFVWSPADKPGVDITDYFLEAGQVLTDPKNPPPIGAQNKELFVTIAPKYGINQSSSLDEYVSATSYKMPKMDNHYRDLVKLLAPDAPDAAPRHCP